MLDEAGVTQKLNGRCLTVNVINVALGFRFYKGVKLEPPRQVLHCRPSILKPTEAKAQKLFASSTPWYPKTQPLHTHVFPFGIFTAACQHLQPSIHAALAQPCCLSTHKEDIVTYVNFMSGMHEVLNACAGRLPSGSCNDFLFPEEFGLRVAFGFPLGHEAT